VVYFNYIFVYLYYFYFLLRVFEGRVKIIFAGLLSRYEVRGRWRTAEWRTSLFVHLAKYQRMIKSKRVWIDIYPITSKMSIGNSEGRWCLGWRVILERFLVK